MKTGYLDFKIFVSPDLNEISANLSGDNQKHVLVVFLDDDSEGMSDYLSKILQSAKLELARDCLLLTIKDGEKFPRFSTISKEFSIKKTLIMGISPKDMGLNIQTPQYQHLFFNNCTFIFTETLSKIYNSAESKKALWACIKEVFLDV